MSLSGKVVIIGAHGQLGRELTSLLPSDVVVPLGREQADLTRPGQMLDLFQAMKPTMVMNCAAYNLVDQCEATPEPAFAVNTAGVRGLAGICNQVGAILVHFSTDYVFGTDAERAQPYGEGDAPGPISNYGMSKLAGEQAVQLKCPNHFVIRTCGLYGRHGIGGKGTNFVETMLKLAGQGRTIKVVSDQVLTPTSVSDLAQATLSLIESNHYGLYHLTNAGQCSWYEFAKAIFEISNVPADLQPTTSKEYGSKAARPAYSVLISQHPHTPRLRHWREALSDYLARSG